MKKFKILIAEDEIAIANLIRNLIDFEQLNLKLCGIASNGQTAYEMIQQEQPDIVVTDLSMPIMSGIELIEKVHEEKLSVHFIIISGLTSFNYALSAIKMGVEDYLLKPINKQELNDVLEKTVLKLASTLKLDTQIQKLGIDSHLRNQKLRRSFIMNLLYNKSQETDLTSEQINEDYGFSFQPYTVYAMGIVMIDGILTLNLAAQNALIEQMMRSFQTTVSDYCTDCEVYNKNNQFLFLLNYLPAQESVILGVLTTLQEDLSAYLESYEALRLTISCGISSPNPSRLAYSLSTAQQTLNARIFQEESRILFAEKLSRSSVKPQYILASSDLGALHSYIEIRDEAKLKNLLISIFKNTAFGCRQCPHLILDAFCDTLSVLLSDLYQHKIITVSLTDTYLKYCDSVEEHTTVKSLILFTVSFIQELLPGSPGEDQTENRQIQTAKLYIQEHYHENLKLEDVAEQVYLAPTYLGALFKKETGESFSSYLTTVRMEEAKELLHDVRYNVAEVALAVGYSDKRYFSRLFKEQVGVTPKEYKKIYAN